MLIDLPFETEEVVWKQQPNEKKLTAVLRFAHADADKITFDAQKFGSPTDVTIPSQPWFPDELTAESEMSGDGTLKGTAYPANPFFQAPFNDGRAVRIEGTDYFVVELSAK